MILKILLTALKQGIRTAKFPAAAPQLPPSFRGRPAIDDDITLEELRRAAAVCPVDHALYSDFEGAKLDMGRCIFCGRCAEVCGKIRFTSEYRLGTFRRADLVVRAGEPEYVPPLPAKGSVPRSWKRSLAMREVSAGGCGACELDANVLNTPAWDMSRFGLRFTASPRHADALYLTGPVAKNMQLPLEKTFAAMPEPRILIAAGACAISGGLYHHGSLPTAPALFIPGCPPHPATVLEALLRLTRGIRGAAATA